MAWVVGSVLAVGVALFARLVGFDRDRAFYPTVLVVVGALYVLFATMTADPSGIMLELPFFILFAALAVIGFKTSLWWVVGGLALHGLFDFVRQSWLPGSGVPGFWPTFCGSYDVVAAAGLAALLLLDRQRQEGRDAGLPLH
jgi:hypothetical protein